MLERRRFPRFKAELPVKFKIFDRDSKTDITNDIACRTDNVSRAGMCLVLPRGWECPQCNNCLGWMFNLSCKLKNNHTQEVNRFVNPKLILKISLSDTTATYEEPIQLEGECVWVNTEIQPEESKYPVGISLSEKDQAAISSYLARLLNP